MKASVPEAAIVTLRTGAFIASVLGQTKLAGLIGALADAAEAGVKIDAHMAEVAERLKTGVPVSDAEIADVMARIQADSDRLQSA